MEEEEKPQNEEVTTSEESKTSDDGKRKRRRRRAEGEDNAGEVEGSEGRKRRRGGDKDEDPNVKKSTLLYVDDEESNLRIFKMAFKRNFDIQTALGGEEALKMLRSNNNIKLIITDQKMPGMTGTELLEKVMPEFPDVVRMILTGFADIEAIVKAVNRCGIYKYITKPWDKGEMKLTIDNALESFDLKNDKNNLIKELEEINATLEQKVEERTEELAEANKRMTESINYAKTIQRAMLPDENYIAEAFDESFVIYKPLDIVSGDFYSFGQVSDGEHTYSIIASVDCAGHGVAGALMSMIGDSLLNSIIYDKGIIDPGEILHNLNDGVQSMLNQAENDSQHGMDASIVVINRDEKKLHFAAAKQELFYCMENDKEVEVVKGDRMSIGGIADVEREYTTKTIDLNSGITFYLSSDGYRDQMGGPNDKKIGIGKFKELLNSNFKLPLTEQKDKYYDYFMDWKGEEHQVDDIMLMGFKLKI